MCVFVALFFQRDIYMRYIELNILYIFLRDIFIHAPNLITPAGAAAIISALYKAKISITRRRCVDTCIVYNA